MLEEEAEEEEAEVEEEAEEEEGTKKPANEEEVSGACYASYECWSGTVAAVIAATVASLRRKPIEGPNGHFNRFADADWVRFHGADYITREFCADWRGQPNDAIPAFVKVANVMQLTTDGRTLHDLIGFGRHRPPISRTIAGLRFDRPAAGSVGHWTAVVRSRHGWVHVDGLTGRRVASTTGCCYYVYAHPARSVGSIPRGDVTSKKKTTDHR